MESKLCYRLMVAETSQKFFGRWKDRESKAFQHKRNRIDWWWTDRYILAIPQSVLGRTRIYHLPKGVPKPSFERSGSINPKLYAGASGPPLGTLVNNNLPSHPRPILAHSSTLWLRVSPPRADVGEIW